MLELFRCLGRANQTAGAAAHRIAAPGFFLFLAHRVATAGGADSRKLEGFRPIGAFVQIDIDNLRNDVAGTLDLHRVTDTKILAAADRLSVLANALDIVFVVEGRV